MGEQISIDIEVLDESDVERIVSEMDFNWLVEEVKGNLDLEYEIDSYISSMNVPSCVQNIIEEEVRAQIKRSMFTPEETEILRGIAALAKKYLKKGEE